MSPVEFHPAARGGLHSTTRPRVLVSDGASPRPCVMRSTGYKSSRCYTRLSKTTYVVVGFSVFPTVSYTAPGRSV